MERTKLHILAGLTLVFFLGSLVGSAGTMIYMKHRIKSFVSGGPEGRHEFLVKRLSRELDLTAAQHDEISRIVKEGLGELRELRERHRPEVQEIHDRQAERIEQVLNQWQKEKFRKFRNEFRPWGRHWRGGPHPGGPPGPPPPGPPPPDQLP